MHLSVLGFIKEGGEGDGWLMVCVVAGKSKMSEPSVLLNYIKTGSRRL